MQPTYPVGWEERPISSEGICYKKGYTNVGEPLNVIQDGEVSVNYNDSISTVEECIALCKQYIECQWWNYNPDDSTCWLKRGQGTERIHIKMYTGHREANAQCPTSVFTPPLLPSKLISDNPISRWVICLFSSNPCPNGQIKQKGHHGTEEEGSEQIMEFSNVICFPTLGKILQVQPTHEIGWQGSSLESPIIPSNGSLHKISF